MLSLSNWFHVQQAKYFWKGNSGTPVMHVPNSRINIRSSGHLFRWQQPRVTKVWCIIFLVHVGSGLIDEASSFTSKSQMPKLRRCTRSWQSTKFKHSRQNQRSVPDSSIVPGVLVHGIFDFWVSLTSKSRVLYPGYYTWNYPVVFLALCTAAATAG